MDLTADAIDASESADATAAPVPHQPPRVLALGRLRTGFELKTFFRDHQAALFTFVLPIALLVVFGSVFTGEFPAPPGEEPVRFRQYFAAGMMASGIFSAAFTSLAISVAVEQHDGLLKRLAGTPLPKTSYFIGKIACTTVLAGLSSGVMLGFGVAFYDIDLPSDAPHWFALGWVFLLGVASAALLGLAYTRLVRSARGATAVVMPPYLLLQFISGIFFVFTEVPEWMQRVAALFPLKWMAQGLRYALLPEWFSTQEAAGRWEPEIIALVLLNWLLLGFALTVRFFRWDRSEPMS